MATVKYFITSEDKTQKGVQSAKRGVSELENATYKLGQSGIKQFNLLNTAIKGGILVSIGLATKAFIDFGKASSEAFRVNETVLLRLEAASRSAGVSFNGLSGYLSQIAKTTMTTGTELQNLTAKFLQLGNSEEQVKSLLETSILLSEATGKTLDSSMTQLAKTFGGTAGELGELIPEMRELNAEQLKAGEALDLVNEKLADYQGLLGNTSAQTVKNFEDSMDSLKTTLGSLTTQFFDPLIERTTRWIDLLNEGLSKTLGGREFRELVNTGTFTLGETQSSLEMQLAAGQAAMAELQSRRNLISSQAGRMGADPFATVDAEIRRVGAAIARITIAMRFSGIAPAPTPVPGMTTPAAQTGEGIGQAAAETFIDVVAAQLKNDLSILNPMTLGINSGAMGASFGGMEQSGTPSVPVYGDGGGSFDLGFDKLKAFTDGISNIAGGFTSLIGSLVSVQAILDPVATILSGVMDVLSPLIDQALAPLIGILTIVGQVVGQMLAPAFQLLAPVITAVSHAFVWFHNNVLKHIGNAMIATIGGVTNAITWIINGIIGLINKIPGVDINRMGYVDIGSTMIQDINVGTLTTTGQGAMGGAMGSSAQYTGGRSYVVNVVVNTSVLTGDNGFEQLAARLKTEMTRQTALGY